MALKKLKRDVVISMTEKGDRVGVYWADSDGRKILFELTPADADKLILAFNTAVDEISKNYK